MMPNNPYFDCRVRFGESSEDYRLVVTDYQVDCGLNPTTLPEYTLKCLRMNFPLSHRFGLLEYERVIFHDPATIVLWKDGTKTVVKCDQRDKYNPETGLALCFMKKALGNKSRYLNDILHKELEKEEKK